MRWIVMMLALAACGNGRQTSEPVTVAIDTYLATPIPGQATREAAGRACRQIGRRAVYAQTRRDGGVGFRHVYTCVP